MDEQLRHRRQQEDILLRTTEGEVMIEEVIVNHHRHGHILMFVFRSYIVTDRLVGLVTCH
jgi:hypothetical protein